MDKKVHIAVIGCGLISKFHIEAIKQVDLTELAGVYAPKKEKAETVAAEYHTRPYYSMDEIWEDNGVDAVCICTPSGTHGQIALSALRHGKHVLIEKPMALDREECRQIVAEAEARGLQAGVISQLRFSPAVQCVKQAVDQGRLGKIISTELNMKYYRDENYFSASSWRGTKDMDGGGALMNQGIHGVDLLQYIAGMPRSVFGQCRTLVHNIEVEDTLNAMLMYGNGALGSIVATTSVYPGFSRKLVICGENGTIALEEDNIVTWALKDKSEKPEFETSKMAGSSDPGRIDNRGHVYQILNFAQAVLGSETLLVDAKEGCKPLEIIWGIYHSAERNEVVEL